MALTFNLGKKKIVNLTIKDYVIRFAEIKNGQDISVSNWGERFLSAGIVKDGVIQDVETFSLILEECIGDWKIAKKQVRFLVPDSSVVIRKLSIPEDVREDEIKGYLYMELGTSIHLPYEDPVFDYHLLEEKDKNKQQIILFASPEKSTAEYSEILEEVKLYPIAADISALALYRYYYHTQKVEDDERIMLLEIGIETVNVSIFEKNYPLFMRHLLIETNTELWQISNSSENLSYTGDQQDMWDSLEDIYKELEKVMNFYRYTLNKGDKQVSKLVVAGDHPWLVGIVERVKERFEQPVVSLTGEKIINDRPIPTSLLVNIGLGLKEV